MTPTVEGYLSKKGKRLGSRVKRFMKLDGHVLSNHHAPSEPPTWQISVRDATITANTKKKKLILEIFNAKMELFCESKEECDRWFTAITAAKKAAQRTDNTREINKDNSQGTSQQNLSHDGVSTKTAAKNPSEDDPTGKKKALDNLNKSFKVVKPQPRQNTDIQTEYTVPEPTDTKKVIQPPKQWLKSTIDMEETTSDSDDDLPADVNVDEEAAHQPKNGKGQIYDDTPSSLIFKQFAFKS